MLLQSALRLSQPHSKAECYRAKILQRIEKMTSRSKPFLNAFQRAWLKKAPLPAMLTQTVIQVSIDLLVKI